MRLFIARLALTSLALTWSLQAQIRNPVVNGDHFDISGTVLDAVTAKPVPRAQVTLQPTDPPGEARLSRTDATGNFVLRNLPVGIYDLSAAKQGYVQGSDALRKVILVSGTQPDRYALNLQPQAVLSGIVTDQDGDPVQGAQATVLRPVIIQGRRRLEPRETAKTDERGSYRFFGLGPGKCYIAIAAPPSAPDAEEAMAYPITFYPNTPESASAQSIDLQPGANEQADVNIAQQDSFEVTGHIDSSTAPVTIHLMPAPDAIAPIVPVFRARLEAKTSAYTLSGLPPGNYIVRADYDQNGRKSSGFRRIAVSGAEVTGIDFAAPQSPLTGSITLTEDHPVEKVVTGLGLQSLFGGASASIKGTKFAFPASLPPGNYRLAVTLAPNWYLQSATQGGRDVLHGYVTIADDGSSLPISLTVSPAGATLAATVTWPDTGHRVPALMTVLQRIDGELLVVAQAEVTPPGETEVTRQPVISGLPPGDYMVYAWPEPADVEYANPDELVPYDSFAQEVTIGEGQQVRVALKVALLNP